MTPHTDSTPTAAPVDNGAAVRIAAVGFKDLADRADLLRQQFRQLGLGCDFNHRLDRIVFSAEVGRQDAERTLAALAAGESGEATHD